MGTDIHNDIFNGYFENIARNIIASLPNNRKHRTQMEKKNEKYYYF